MKENKPTAINQNPIPSKPFFKCQKCQHDSINAKELNGFDVDDFLHDKTSFVLRDTPIKRYVCRKSLNSFLLGSQLSYNKK